VGDNFSRQSALRLDGRFEEDVLNIKKAQAPFLNLPGSAAMADLSLSRCPDLQFPFLGLQFPHPMAISRFTQSIKIYN
jgi:hypothetical protein